MHRPLPHSPHHSIFNRRLVADGLGGSVRSGGGGGMTDSVGVRRALKEDASGP